MNGASAQEDGPLAQLRERLGRQDGTRLARTVLASARALDGLALDVRPTAEELRVAIAFLTEVGHATDERRQEWVLLADVIGVSTLVEDLNAPRPSSATPNTLAGPFHRAGVPEVPDGGDLSRDGKGERMTVAGRVAALDGAEVGGAMVEVWHAHADGRYENQEPDLQPDSNLRGVFRTGEDGRYLFWGAKPRFYPIPDDGPVGAPPQGAQAASVPARSPPLHDRGAGL
jgi:protocatechuate 3,4-dioxygenase beta subunit